jgi:hypothetical protein
MERWNLRMAIKMVEPGVDTSADTLAYKAQSLNALLFGIS